VRARSGFTLIELLVVMAIIAVLLYARRPALFRQPRRSKEAVLREDLYQLRDADRKYYGDKGKYPESLDALASEKYLRKVPSIPSPRAPLPGVIAPGGTRRKAEFTTSKSGAQGKASDGSVYTEW